MPKELNDGLLIDFAKTAVRESHKDVNVVLDSKWSKPLKEYFSVNT